MQVAFGLQAIELKQQCKQAAEQAGNRLTPLSIGSCFTDGS